MSSFSTVWFDSDQTKIGTFHCPAYHPAFNKAGQIFGHTVVFPRTSVTITHEGGDPIVADPNVVMFYNQNQPYRRGKLSEQGDVCDWFGYGPTAVLEAIRTFEPGAEERQPAAFCFTHGPSASAIYLQQRRLIHYLQQTAVPDPLPVEEVTLAILHQALAHVYQACLGPHEQRRPQSRTARLHADMVQAVKELLASRFTESLSLEQIATAVYTSPYHLSRIFRQATGFTIHRYLNQLRLRAALAYVAQPDANLADVGLELGYSSHSHFTHAFRRAFGTAPSTFREAASGSRLRQMSKILTA